MKFSVGIYESERGEWKSCLKAQHSENEDHGILSHHFMGNKCKKAKSMSGEALQIAVKRRDVKSKREKKYILNAEFQRLAGRNEKAFLSDQCKEIKENNRMGKTRDLFKKIRDTKGTFHAEMGSIS